ncbi:MAG TPA: ABC transporter substrate-binding protein [Burkholderiales bacterium]|nr:ABC transporter substrate-binding protein [Burkholderiales bacterium]
MTRVLLALFLLGISFGGNAQTNVRFLHEWRFEGHVAPFLVAIDKGYYQAEGLNVTIDPGTGSLDSINRVATKAYDMSVADINSLMRYRDNAASAPVKAVMMVYDSPPFAILTLKKNGINKPKDLEGKTLGAPAADGAWAQFPILARVNNMDPSKVRVENVGFPVREALLAQGKVDAVTAFGSNALGVVAQGVPRDDVVVLMMRRFGLDLYGSAILAHPDFMKAQPKAVSGFVRALIKGFQETFRDPDAAIESVMKRNPVAKRDIELARLKLVIEQSYITDDVRANGFGGVDMKRLDSAIDQVGIAFKFTNKPKAADIFTAEFLPPKEQRLVK